MDLIFSILMDAFFIALLAWCAYTDLKARTVSNLSVILLLCLGLAHTGLLALDGNAWWPYPAGLLLCTPFFISWMRNGIGAGDVKLVMGIGLYLGLMNTLIAFVLMMFVLVVLAIWLWRKGGTTRREIPLAPVISIGAFSTIVLGYICVLA